MTQQQQQQAPAAAPQNPQAQQLAADQAALAAALQAQQNPQAAPPAQPPQTPPVQLQQTPPATLKVPEAPAVTVEAVIAEYTSTGGVSAETRAAVKAANPLVTDAVLDQFLAGQKVTAETQAAKAVEVVGGRQAYDTMAQWAAANFTPEQRAAYNSAVTSGDPNVRENALLALKARYDAANKAAPQILKGATQGTQPAGEPPFANMAQVTAAMRDPRYRSDPAYRASVADRLSRSTI